MYRVELYARRRACHVDGLSIRAASRLFGLDRKTVRKMPVYSVPSGYRREAPRSRPKHDPYTGIIDRILEDDEGRPRIQRHGTRRSESSSGFGRSTASTAATTPLGQ